MKKSAGLILFKPDKSVLIVRPSQGEQYSIPKGKIEKEETKKEAAIRETFEETGLLYEGTIYSVGHVTYKNKRKKVYGFVGFVENDVKINNNSWEVDIVDFFTINQAKKLLHPSHVELLERACEVANAHLKSS